MFADEEKRRTMPRHKLETLCWAFHKQFMGVDIGMYKAIKTLNESDYIQAMEDSLKEIGIDVVGEKIIPVGKVL